MFATIDHCEFIDAVQDVVHSIDRGMPVIQGYKLVNDNYVLISAANGRHVVMIDATVSVCNAILESLHLRDVCTELNGIDVHCAKVEAGITKFTVKASSSVGNHASTM